MFDKKLQIWGIPPFTEKKKDLLIWGVTPPPFTDKIRKVEFDILPKQSIYFLAFYVIHGAISILDGFVCFETCYQILIILYVSFILFFYLLTQLTV